MRSLAGLSPRALGGVRWNDMDVTGCQQWWTPPRVAYASQSAGFIAGTVLENMTLGDPNVTVEGVIRALRAVGLEPNSPDLPDGLQTVIQSGRASSVSGGQRQRLALARALCRSAELYLVDDCDSALDAETARSMWARILSKWPATWIVVSRNADLASKAQIVVEIKSH